MTQYKVYAAPEGEYEAVKQGWSWPGFFFTFVWAFVKKMRTLAFGIVSAFAAAGLAGSFTGGGVAFAVKILVDLGAVALMFAFGRKGNMWLEADLLLKGFELKGLVAASGGDEAVKLVKSRILLVPGAGGIERLI